MNTSKLRRVLAALGLAVLAGGLAPVASAEPASQPVSAAVTVHVTGVVNMHIQDYETVLPNEDCYFTQPVDFFWSSNSGTAKFIMVGHCGGEVRVEVDHLYNVSNDGVLHVHAVGRLYEGANSHDTTDLNGTNDQWFSIPSGGAPDLSSLALHNTDEGHDWAFIDFQLTTR
ncbi:hypothetical protein AB0G02_15930 [Actinosynnema sp. NPDC023658]|uniref:hypothetical protein n=1 Tax=Actinosynnema sp. NPDC023658 TaxID=3155465 RepID=UPI00340A61BD